MGAGFRRSTPPHTSVRFLSISAPQSQRLCPCFYLRSLRLPCLFLLLLPFLGCTANPKECTTLFDGNRSSSGEVRVRDGAPLRRGMGMTGEREGGQSERGGGRAASTCCKSRRADDLAVGPAGHLCQEEEETKSKSRKRLMPSNRWGWNGPRTMKRTSVYELHTRHVPWCATGHCIRSITQVHVSLQHGNDMKVLQWKAAELWNQNLMLCASMSTERSASKICSTDCGTGLRRTTELAIVNAKRAVTVTSSAELC